jgi:serine/threonine-protein kinase
MATVHFGRLLGPAGFSRTVAVKRLHPTFAKDPAVSASLIDEARLASRVRHPNVVQAVDVVAEGDDLLLVLEYVQGDSLASLLQAGRSLGSLPPAEVACAILCDALRGLHAAHEAKSAEGEPLGLVHRDVSPQNILVHQDGVALVTDFGVARAIGRITATREGEVKGKPAYMAPEQVRGEEVTRRTDVFAAGIVLWEALTGKRLFRGDNLFAIATKVADARVDPPSRVRPEAPRSLDAVVLRALARAPEDRFATAEEMRAAIEAACAPASPSAVAVWVRSVATDRLRERTERVREVEAFDADAPSRADAPRGAIGSDDAAPGSQPWRGASSAPEQENEGTTLAGTTAPRLRWRAMIAGALGLALLGGGAAAIAISRGADEAPALASSAGASAAASAGAPGQPVISPAAMTGQPAISPAAMTGASDSAGAAAAPAPQASNSAGTSALAAPSRAGSPAPKPAARTAASKPPAAGCNPPYYVDARGITVYKAACLAPRSP